MASPTFNHAVLGETFLPRQIFEFGGFALRANSLGHLEQIDSYAPGHQVRFGNLNYTTDICGDLIFDRFKPVSGAPNNHDMHDLDQQSDSIQNIAPAEGVLDKGVSRQPDYIHRPDYRSVKIQDSRLRLVSRWDSPLRGR